MNMILSADLNWGIGCNNKLLVSIPSDMKFFREETTGKVVVMGRKTLESFPNGMPLANRTNIVLTQNPDFQVKGAVVVRSHEELMEELKQYRDDEIYVIGGESIYRMMLPYCDTVHVTKINFAYEADTHFPNLDDMPEWEVTATSDEQTYFDLEFTFVKYERKKETV
ncbi:dihydrofolate reductase [Ruminococcus gauvreauii]|uniref:Dihydrofolate reductase n=1 Tax=Ruminococcus gauvreauii TaxID=438033 RepID=A0ABY5VEG7_9FIRM|nr:dihydrofolate reductase [Ruminococcus gauvreauii]UWP58945.1 dihydrofolate reductase [Ruminococcus gauvreauii]